MGRGPRPSADRGADPGRQHSRLDSVGRRAGLMHSLPVFLRLLGRAVILTGEGEAADAKRRWLERAGARNVGGGEGAALANRSEGAQANVQQRQESGIWADVTQRTGRWDISFAETCHL